MALDLIDKHIAEAKKYCYLARLSGDVIRLSLADGQVTPVDIDEVDKCNLDTLTRCCSARNMRAFWE